MSEHYKKSSTFRRGQRYVLKSVGLRGRLGKVNHPEGEMSERLIVPNGSRHMWVCPGCAIENSPHYLSCRWCQSLKWGVAP